MTRSTWSRWKNPRNFMIIDDFGNLLRRHDLWRLCDPLIYKKLWHFLFSNGDH